MIWLYLLLAVLALALVYLLRLPARYSVSRSVLVPADAAQVFARVNDLRQWPQWNPWLLHDPQTEMDFEGDGRSVGSAYRWRSSKIGEGRMSHVQVQAPQQLDLLLEFFKPFKSRADVRFDFTAVDAQHTEVRWSMSAALPLPMRPMRAMFERMIGTDFELGLARLVGSIDPASEHPRIEFVGVVQRSSQRVACVAYQGPLSGLSAFFEPAYARLHQAVGAAFDPQRDGPPLAAYDKVDAKNQSTQGCAALPVPQDFALAAGAALADAQAADSPIHLKTLPGGRYFQVRLHGHYRFLGVAWHASTGQVRMQKLKFDPQRPALEVYAQGKPQHAHSNDWVTELYVPIR